MRRCGTSELLTGLMSRLLGDALLQASCAALIAALASPYAGMPPELSSHYDFEAAALVCVAMGTHRSNLHVQRHGCAALHALACRSTPLAEEVVRHDGVRLVTKAMSTYRTDSAARLQASARGALIATDDLHCMPVLTTVPCAIGMWRARCPRRPGRCGPQHAARLLRASTHRADS